MRRLLRIFALSLIGLLAGTSWATAQTQAFVEEFNDTSQFAVVQGSLGQDGDDNYFLLAQNASPAIDKSYAGADGSFLAAQDTDDPDVGPSPAAPVQIAWTGIDITGLSNLVFNGAFAEVLDDEGDIDASDFLLLEYQIDGGGYQPLLAFENDGSGSNTTFLEDTDFDGTGDGASITSSDGTMTTFTKGIPGTGASLDLRFTAHVNAGDEDVAIDDFTVVGASGPVPPSVQFAATGATVSEDAGTATVAVELTNPDGSAVSVDVVLDAGSSADASDLGGYTTQTVTFPSDASDGATRQITIDVTDDDATEGPEVATFALQNLTSSGAAAIGTPGTFDLSIDDNDVSTQIIISQYAEDGNLKGVELLNVSDGPIDFSAQPLVLNRYANGSPSPTEEVAVSSGTLASGDVIVFADSENTAWADASIAFTDVNLQFNGNDALEVVLGGITQDVFGTIGQDPGGSWAANGVDTRDQNLEVRSSIMAGDPDGWTDPSVRFRTIDAAPLDNGSSDGGLDDFQDVDGFGTGDPLPVELTAFTVAASGTVATLAWETASETNNAGFEVQHRAPGASADAGWMALGFVDGAGTTDVPQAYRFRTRALAPGVHTFRLKQVDFDGTVALSPERTLTVRTGRTLTLRGPNPMRSGQQMRLTVQVAAPQPVRVALYNILGQRVATLFRGTASPQAPAQATLSTGRLASGVYFVRVSGPSAQATERITVVR